MKTNKNNGILQNPDKSIVEFGVLNSLGGRDLVRI